MNYIWVIEYRKVRGKGAWLQTDTSAVRKSKAQRECKNLNLAWKDNEFRVVKYKRVEGE